MPISSVPELEHCLVFAAGTTQSKDSKLKPR